MTKIETLTVWANQRLRAKGQTDTQTDITTTRLNRSQGQCSEIILITTSYRVSAHEYARLG